MSDFETVEHSGDTRVLSWLPTPTDHPFHVSALPTWESTGLPTLALKDIPPFKRHWDSVPILDQNGKGACLPHAWTAATMIARAISGAPYVPLSPWFLYSLINHGQDSGSNAGDACQALTETGICAADLVPYGTIGPAGYNEAAKTAAARFKLRPDGAVSIQGFEQAVSAAYYGWCVCFDLCAGGGFDVDSDGVCAFLGGGNNHEVMAGEEFAMIGGQPRIGGRNSWGTRWGVNGRCLWTPQHLDGSQETYAVRFVIDDPQDNTLPPAVN